MSLPGKADLNDLIVFEAAAECGSFSSAAARLGVANAKVSLEIARLEKKLGLSLFHRTTRKVTLTNAGLDLYEECRPLLCGLANALERAGAQKKELVGTLRISSTVDHAVHSLGPALVEFSQCHPHLAIDLRTSERVVDLLDDGIDLAIRLGWLKDSSLHAVKFGEFQQHLVAAPAYVRAAGLPQTPADLGEMEWIALSLLPTPLTWRFHSSDGETATVQVRGRIKVDSPAVLRVLLESGAGISVLDHFNASKGIASGRLCSLLPDWHLPPAGIYGVYPSGKLLTAKVRTFIDFYRHYLVR